MIVTSLETSSIGTGLADHDLAPCGMTAPIVVQDDIPGAAVEVDRAPPIVEYVPRPSTGLRLNPLRYTEVHTVKRLYALARDISRIFEECGLFYWTSGGTTLGIVRHGGLIPWDDDLDFCIKQEDLPHLLSMKSALAKEGLTLQQYSDYIWKVYHTEGSTPISHSHCSLRYPFADVFVMSEDDHDRYVICHEVGRSYWPDEFYLKEQVAAVTPRRFGNALLPCPADPELYLDRNYGPDWRRKGATHILDHQGDDWLESTEFELVPEMLEPAKPFE